MAESFDYVIVGGGSAGCVLAGRLSEDPDVSVALIEAGGEHDRFLVNMPLGYGKTINSPEYSWQIHSEPEQSVYGRSFYHPRGRLLGGSSSINGLLYIRGQHQDYDDWEQAGADGWGWEAVKPYFIRAEDNGGGADEWRGAAGPLRVEGARDRYPIEEVLIESGIRAGHRANPDFNGARQDGIGRYQATMKGGRRWSAADAYLAPARARPNLAVFTGSRAERVTFDGRRANGVSVRHGGKSRVLEARREVLLCAGAFLSPQLLQLSGIGPGALLREHGIEVRADNPSVGENLHDHTGAPMSWRMKNKNDSINRKIAFPRIVSEALRYAFTKRGVMAMPAASVGIFADSSGQGGRPDLQFHCLPLSGNLDTEIERGEAQLDPFPGLTMMPYPLRPKSRGRVAISSGRPEDLPSVRLNWFDDPADMAVMIRGLRIAQAIADTEPLAGRIESRVYPAPEARSDDDLEDFARTYCHVAYHPVGSCRMGSDTQSVVDCDLRVRGFEGLRVVDGSVIPRITSGNTNAPIIMIAEKISDRIRGLA